ncbi:MAG: nucleotidyltransferase domain-containing protein [Bacillota bacterium]|nr:nucleotidyltransferase domain-containing protein [Bacillota bacterium]
MPGTAKDLTPENMKQYREFLKEKEEQERLALQIRFRCAWDVAKRAAQILYQKYGAARVAVFGSLTDPARYTKWSDIDLAVWGIPDDLFYKAVAGVISMNPDFRIDVVDPEDCSDSLRKAIEKEGVTL